MSLEPKLEVLSAAQRTLWLELASVPDTFVLYSGTGLALRLGHRASVDFDFFSSQPFKPAELFPNIDFLEDAEVLQTRDNTLTVSIDRGDPVKASFFGDINFGRVGHPDMTTDGTIAVASLLDLFGTKLKVLLERVEAKDYLDLEALLRSGLTLAEGLGAATALFGNQFPPMEAVKALSYFDEGDARTLPSETKKYLTEQTTLWDFGAADIEIAARELHNP